jgi:hypothetical protein
VQFRRRARFGIALFAAGLLAACGDSEPAEETPPGPAPRSCFPPDGFDGTPGDVEEMVDLINALGPSTSEPVTIPCILEVFDRPLELNATANIFSAQPAFGPNNPRIFIFREELVVSVVPKGDGRPLMEFGVFRTPTRSVKAEIAFPVTQPIDFAAPYQRLRVDDPTATGTKCAFCHFSETLDPSIDFAEAYISDVVFPHKQDAVDLDYLTWAFDTCDRELEPDRCSMLDGIFAQGDVVWRDF